MKTRTFYVALGITVAMGCSSSSTTTNNKTSSANEQACLDMADAVGKAAERCGQDYAANRSAFIQNAVKGDCANTVSVRDEASLRSTCIPYFGTVSCADLLAGKVDDTCKAQLVHTAFEPALSTASAPVIGDAIGATSGPSY
jgi:hypothetical protein